MPSRLTRRPGTSRTSGARRHLDPVVAVVVAAGLCGLAVGSALRADPVPPPPAPASGTTGVFASFDVIGMVLDPGPVALQDVAVHNAGSEPVRIREVTVAPPGLPPVTTGVDQVVEPDDLAVVAARADLACGAVPGIGGMIGATVTLVPSAATEPTTVLAVRSVAEALLPACLAAERRLPRAAATRPVAGRLDLDGDGPIIVAEGLPIDSVVDGAVTADPTPPFTRWRFVLAAPATVRDDGTVRVPLAQLAGARTMCGTYLATWPTLPTGITVTYTDGSGTPTDAYVGVGPDFTRWALATYRKNCPREGN